MNTAAAQVSRPGIAARPSERLAATDVFAVGDSVVLRGTPSQPLVSISDPLIAHGRVYVTDIIGNKLLEFDLRGSLLRTLGRKGTGSGEFQMPYGVAADSAGRIYVNDRANARIQVFDAALRHIETYEVGGQHEQMFILDGHAGPYILVQGVTRCDDPAGCLLTGLNVSEHAKHAFAPVDVGATVFTWRAAVSRDGVAYLANVFGDSVLIYSVTGHRLGGFSLQSPSRSIPPGLHAPASSAEFGVVLHRLQQERYTQLSSLVSADGVVFVQYRRINPAAGEPTAILDIYTPTGCLLYAGIPTPGLLTANGASLYFVSHDKTGYGRATIVPVRPKPISHASCSASRIP